MSLSRRACASAALLCAAAAAQPDMFGRQEGAVVRLSDVEQVVQAGGAAADAALRAAARERTLHSARCEGTHFLCDGPNEVEGVCAAVEYPPS